MIRAGPCHCETKQQCQMSIDVVSLALAVGVACFTDSTNKIGSVTLKTASVGSVHCKGRAVSNSSCRNSSKILVFNIAWVDKHKHKSAERYFRGISSNFESFSSDF